MKKIAALGLGHGLNDCIAGYVLGSLVSMQIPVSEAGLSILVYNIIAFGGQMAFAVLAKEKPYPRFWLLSCYLMLAASLLLLHVNYQSAVLLVAFSSMIIHVVGGHESSSEDGKARGLGIFAAPGVLGLMLGGYFSFVHYDFLPAGITGCTLLAAVTFFLRFTRQEKEPSKSATPVDQHDLLMLLLLTVIALRSAIWDVFQLLYEHKQEVLLPVAFAAMAGKLAGGFIGDQIGHRRHSLFALGLSLPFLSFAKQNIPLLCTGIFLLQSSFPSLSRLMIDHFRRDRHMGAAFTFGLPIVLGAILFYTPLKSFGTSTVSIVLLHLFCILLLLVGMRKKTLRG